MGKRILDSKLLYAILALFIAVGLWFYVAVTENQDGEAVFHNVPVVFLNEDLLNDNNLMIVEGSGQTVTLTFMGARTLLADLNSMRDELWVTVDVGRIPGTGEQRLAYDISYPTGGSRFSNGLSVIERTPNNISFTVAAREFKNIPVEGRFVGSLADGFMTDEFVIRPDTIEIVGTAEQVNQVSHALVTVSGDHLEQSFNGDMGFSLISFQGEELTDVPLEYSPQTVAVTLPVLQTADVPLEVELVNGGGAVGGETAHYEIDPETIAVSGSREDLEPLKKLVLGQINLADVTVSGTHTFPIILDSALNNISGVTEAAVTVRLEGLESRTMITENFELINSPYGFTAESVTRSLQVVIRGPEGGVEPILGHQLRVVADLSEVSAAEGRYTVPAKVYLDGASDVGVVGSDYKIVVSLSRTVD